jgi:spermidine/putrescine-binding protein
MTMRTIMIRGAATLAACGVLGMAPAAAQASSAPVPTWTKQAPATSPPGRRDAVMAYDAATGTAVLFGGLVTDGLDIADSHVVGGTWTWDGATWTKQAPAVSPPPR